ncbi:hypothetical protein UA08_08788 [Talaromyces atroroseus]|uniref:Protein RTA1 n=1 Tax=Talaromyces atroroseus TaxID=1441469 RepID=A0A225ANU0_TALAT|nr:hypothetical protein UA08_08788 [Talaromyces atroroseus]OKL56095.1 hypothetical protein UA08_08788 [Talaromyces atroroseus]
MAETCTAISVPGTYWSFCPNVGAAGAFLAFFLLAFLVHVAQGIYHRKWYTWVIAMSALWQTITYILRIVSIKTPASLGDYAGWFVLILVAPLWTNAFVYMVFGRMVWNYVPDASIRGIRAWKFGMYFVVLDIIAFIIQVSGAASAESSNTETVAQTLQGIHIYMGGVALQQVFIFVFCYFAYELWHSLHKQQKSGIKVSTASPNLSIQSGLVLLYALGMVLVLITLRILFRLAEYAHGLTSTIPNHEAYQYCLDSLPMLLAFVILSVVHPGSIMKGPECEIPSRKKRKASGIMCKKDVVDDDRLHEIC